MKLSITILLIHSLIRTSLLNLEIHYDNGPTPIELGTAPPTSVKIYLLSINWSISVKLATESMYDHSQISAEYIHDLLNPLQINYNPLITVIDLITSLMLIVDLYNIFFFIVFKKKLWLINPVIDLITYLIWLIYFKSIASNAHVKRSLIKISIYYYL